MKFYKVIPLLFLYLFTTFAAFAQSYDTSGGSVTFAFNHVKGERSRILSTVDEDIYFNSQFDHHSQIVNRVTAEVTEAYEDGSGMLDCIYMTTEDASKTKDGAKFNYGEEYHSIFKRSCNGTYDISDEYFMPTVRDVPVFPNHEVNPGDTWTANGHEAHDLRKSFNYEKPYKVPFTATYKYLGTVKTDGIILDVISVKYSTYFETPENNIGETNQYEDWPVSMMAYSDELIYWNRSKNDIDHYSESFRIQLETAYGNIFEYKGTAHAEVTYMEKTSTPEQQQTVEDKVEDLNIDNVTVHQGDRGLVITLEDIKFKPDSSELLDSEKEKIIKIAELLKDYPDNDILVTGHTALAGNEKSRKQLSEQRAQAVADFLIQLEVKDPYHIFTQGLGATQPIAPNNTEEGKAKNRRVEITIMDK